MSEPASLFGAVFGSYRVLDLLGEGGMGTIYRAEHILIGKKVAMKVLRPEYAERPEVVERFFTEAKAVNKIGHHNIVDISDYGHTSDGRPFFIMELLQGQPLTAALGESKTLPLRRAAHILRQVGSALDASHAAGIIHRDLKPENIFLIRMGDDPDFVKLFDFGIAKLLSESRQNTLAGGLVGTPQYMAPEQVRNAKLNGRTDVYAMGVVLYELLTGTLPFQGKTTQHLLAQVLTEPPCAPRERNPALPEGVERVILRALEKSPEDRFQSASALAEAFLRALPSEGEGTSRQTRTGLAVPAAGPRPLRVFVLMAGAGLVLALVFLLGLSGRSPQEATATSAPPVVLRIHSEPAGAAVSLNGEALCTTPCEVSRPASSAPGVLQLGLDGYAPKALSITLHESQRVAVQLAALLPESGPASAPTALVTAPSTLPGRPKPPKLPVVKSSNAKGGLDGRILQPKKR